MTTLVEQLSVLQQRAQDSLAIEKIRADAEAVEGRIGQLKAWTSRLEAMTPAAKAIRRHDPGAQVATDVGGLKRSAERALSDVQSEPTALRRPDATAANAFWGRADSRIAEMRRELASQWQGHVNGLMPPYEAAVVRALAGAEAASVESQIAQATRRVQLLASRLPATDEETSEPDEVARELATILARFDLSGEPADVRAFIGAALDGGAPIGLITDTVRAWLRDRGIEDNVRVVFRGS